MLKILIKKSVGFWDARVGAWVDEVMISVGLWWYGDDVLKILTNEDVVVVVEIKLPFSLHSSFTYVSPFTHQK